MNRKGKAGSSIQIQLILNQHGPAQEEKTLRLFCLSFSPIGIVDLW